MHNVHTFKHFMWPRYFQAVQCMVFLKYLVTHCLLAFEAPVIDMFLHTVKQHVVDALLKTNLATQNSFIFMRNKNLLRKLST